MSEEKIVKHCNVCGYLTDHIDGKCRICKPKEDKIKVYIQPYHCGKCGLSSAVVYGEDTSSDDMFKKLKIDHKEKDPLCDGFPMYITLFGDIGMS